MECKISWLLYSLLLLNILRRGSTECFNVCTCKWKNGKQTVDCNNTTLTEIPDGMDPETQVLKFSGNNLNSLESELFLKKQIINLQRIYLSHCKIKTIHAETFKGLTNLVEIDLSNNLLDTVPTSAFINCPSLMKLALNFNRIKTLKKFSFNHLSYLNTLELSNCEISDIEEGAFQGLHSLEWLHLDSNKLKTIRGRRTLPENVKGVELQKNAWECDCHIQDLNAWLQDFNVPLTVEPVCRGPPSLTGRTIKSIPAAELACLPDISPTAFYLELGEGKNVSLLCHVHAIPEATVSWWFQGQMLQNNTMVAPGVHLIYFVEEGSENKRSELFIYNANADDNGTFICNAENAAGAAQSNFTIKIILKEEPIVIIVSFPFEYFLFTIIGIAVLALIIIIVFTILIWKCYRRRKRQQKQKNTKQETLEYQQNVNNKCSMFDDTNTNSSPVPTKQPISNLVNNDNDEIITTYGTYRSEEIFGGITPTGISNQIRSPSALKRYQLEQNPDLINGTESIGCRREGDGEDERIHEARAFEDHVNTAIPIACLRGNTELYKDVRCIVDAEGYPVDYGLPKLSYQTQCNENYYRTLPCNRIKRHSAANPINRFSREAEFLSRSVDSAQYDNFHTNVRYTADGYPAKVSAADNPTSPTFISSIPSSDNNYGNATDTTEGAALSSLPCCSVQWPTCVPANLHIINANLEYSNQTKFAGVSKRCVSAQTDTECEADELTENKIDSNVGNTQNDIGNEVLTESPDEGYEGEPSVV